MGDLRSNNELVYAMGLNPLEGCIMVIFWGLGTRADFVMDSKFALVQPPDPHRFNDVKGDDPGGDVGVHQGFHEYLMGKRDGGTSKYAEIVAIVEKLRSCSRRQHPPGGRYKLYVTGHSLGGAKLAE
jgi:hypothetical protein